MSVVRRVLFRRAAGAVAATTIAARNAQGAAEMAVRHAAMPMPYIGPGGAALPIADPADHDRKWKLLEKLSRAAKRVSDRQDRVANTLGLPPHLASMNSTAPWWRAQRAALWWEERHDRERSLWDRLKRQVGLE